VVKGPGSRDEGRWTGKAFSIEGEGGGDELGGSF